MDPKETLQEMRALSARIVNLSDLPENAAIYMRIAEAANELAERVQALDAWLLSGGFSPWDGR